MKEQLVELRVFVEVARTGGFRSAAKRLGQSPGSVSQTVQRFEDRLGVRLLERTTRRVSLTEPGRQLFEQCEPSVTDVEVALRAVEGGSGEVEGVLRLSAPTAVGPLFLDDLLGRYLQAYPKVQVDVSYDDRKVDMVSLGLDATVRSASLLEEDTFRLPVGPKVSMAVVAAPAYLDEVGPFRRPADLTRADGVCFRLANSGRLAPWRFTGPEGEYEVIPKPRLIVDSMGTLMELAAAGVGVAYTYAHFAEQQLDEGRLVRLFPKSTPKIPRFAINYISRRNMPLRLRAFLEMASAVPRD